METESFRNSFANHVRRTEEPLLPFSLSFPTILPRSTPICQGLLHGAIHPYSASAFFPPANVLRHYCWHNSGVRNTVWQKPKRMEGRTFINLLFSTTRVLKCCCVFLATNLFNNQRRQIPGPLSLTRPRKCCCWGAKAHSTRCGDAFYHNYINTRPASNRPRLLLLTPINLKQIPESRQKPGQKSLKPTSSRNFGAHENNGKNKHK